MFTAKFREKVISRTFVVSDDDLNEVYGKIKSDISFL